MKNLSGCPVLPSATVNSSTVSFSSCKDDSQSKLEKEIDVLEKKHKDLLNELSAAQDTIVNLHKKNYEQDKIIETLENQVHWQEK